ncbi:uncharacterized protein MICPUCDRAFT_60639 [Micromonas pusilla CCMP1545]|uniref:Predicted protein n=1 Tax=Micromonas pusilla (strain CCMP1545) TaxID=564608 RepID=C1MZ84_MICPC|nr:uncharacterized protein MICPUCDRAFT_60639 [Micromonas pusilla CCMP1545]EEH54820.1 predicted protein [Micromonas pusilla CCMP1545]|eukprot:XP_003061170.1 predicted protein [Micromonas pusilla CCMP1545]
MAEDGARPRVSHPPRPSSRDSSNGPCRYDDDDDADAPVRPIRDDEENASEWDLVSNRVLTALVSGDASNRHPRELKARTLRRTLDAYKDENDSLGEALMSMKAALQAANEEKTKAIKARDVAVSAGESLRETLERNADATGALARANDELKSLKKQLADVEQLACDLRDDLQVAENARDHFERKAADALAAVAAATHENEAAAELRDRVQDLERYATVHAAQAGIVQGLEVVLAEAREAAASANADRESQAALWRERLKRAEKDHLAELSRLRARVADAENGLDAKRAELKNEIERRHALETRLADALKRERRTKADQHGAAESLRLMAQHEHVLREAARTNGETIARMRDDAATAAARCERATEHVALLTREVAASTARAEAAEAEAEAAREEARNAWAGRVGVSGYDAARRAGRGVAVDADPDVPLLVAAAVRVGESSPNSFAAGMRVGVGGGGGARGDGSPASEATSSSTSCSPPGGGEGFVRGRWIESVGPEVAEELVHALAREVAESRARETARGEELLRARESRNDAQRALLAEVHRVHELERMRVCDVRELQAAEQRARNATAAVLGMRDQLAGVVGEKARRRGLGDGDDGGGDDGGDDGENGRGAGDGGEALGPGVDDDADDAPTLGDVNVAGAPDPMEGFGRDPPPPLRRLYRSSIERQPPPPRLPVFSVF